MTPSFSEAKAAPRVPWSNVYGVARSLIALGTLITLLLHDGVTLFRPLGVSIASQASDDFLVRWSIFSLLGDARVELARWICIVVLLLVVAGWRPRWTALPHWWIAWSFAGSSLVVNGGEQVATVLTFLLLPVALTDPRRWHWSPWVPPAHGLTAQWHMQHVTAGTGALLIRIQVALIYFEAAVTKLSVEEWKNGTAVYYWFTNPGFGMPDWLAPVVMPVLTHEIGVTLATWGAVAIEVTLFLALTMSQPWRRVLLPIGVLFHLSIAVVHGLGIFFLSMAGALVLYLWPLESPFSWRKLRSSADRVRGQVRIWRHDMSVDTPAEA
jgi:antimicrobial peptide system SdpB family protein